MSIKIDPEFQALIPPLSKDEFKQLEENIVRDGIRDPLVVWKVPCGDQILIDGHNRWKISARHAGIPFEIKEYKFQDRAEVKAWIIKNQLGRRNINAFVRSELALLLKPAIAAKAKENALATQKNNSASAYQKSDKQINTAKELAKAAGVSHDTIHKVEVIRKKAPEETKDALRRGELSINEVYSGIRAAEVETVKQQEARELREAKKRHEEFQEQKKESVVSFQDAKKDKEDAQRIFNDFYEDLMRLDKQINQINISISLGEFKDALQGAKTMQLLSVESMLREWMRSIVKAQRLLGEVKNEAQSVKAPK